MTEAITMNTHKLKPAIEYILTAPTNVDGVDAQLDAAWIIYDAEVTPSSVIAMISYNERLKAANNILHNELKPERQRRFDGNAIMQISEEKSKVISRRGRNALVNAMGKESSHD